MFTLSWGSFTERFPQQKEAEWSLRDRTTDVTNIPGNLHHAALLQTNSKGSCLLYIGYCFTSLLPTFRSSPNFVLSCAPTQSHIDQRSKMKWAHTQWISVHLSVCFAHTLLLVLFRLNFMPLVFHYHSSHLINMMNSHIFIQSSICLESCCGIILICTLIDRVNVKKSQQIWANLTFPMTK